MAKYSIIIELPESMRMAVFSLGGSQRELPAPALTR